MCIYIANICVAVYVCVCLDVDVCTGAGAADGPDDGRLRARAHLGPGGAREGGRLAAGDQRKGKCPLRGVGTLPDCFPPNASLQCGLMV